MGVTPDSLDRFSPLTRRWFTGTFAEPTQAQAWEAIADGDHTSPSWSTLEHNTVQLVLHGCNLLERLVVDG